MPAALVPRTGICFELKKGLFPLKRRNHISRSRAEAANCFNTVYCAALRTASSVIFFSRYCSTVSPP